LLTTRDDSVMGGSRRRWPWAAWLSGSPVSMKPAPMKIPYFLW